MYEYLYLDLSYNFYVIEVLLYENFYVIEVLLYEKYEMLHNC